ncbi:MAG: PAS domain S-box protein [Opitutus sp.]|nr:PAS domain S-box protein [Opitutus sp.]
MASNPPTDHAAVPPEEELRLDRERLELALTASNTCTWEIDIPGNILRIDARWAAMLGDIPRPTEPIQHALLRDVHPDDRAESMRRFRACYEGGDGIYRGEQRVLTQRGDYIWVLSVGRVVARDARGRATRILGTNTDITRLKHAEAELQRVNAQLERTVRDRTDALAETDLRLRTLFEHAAVGLAEADVKGRLIRVNPRYCAMLGYTEAEMLAKTVVEISHPAEMPLNRMLMAELIAGARREFSLEKRYFRKDGSEIWAEIKVAALWAPGAAPDHVVAMLQDISERKANEVMLRENEEKFRSVFDRSPVIICLLSMPKGHIVEANAAAVAAFGYSREEAIGRTTPDLNVWADADERAQYLALLAANGELKAFEARMRRKDGSVFSALYNGSIVSIGGRPFSLNLLQDISERKEAEHARDQLLALTQATLESTTDGILVVDAHGRMQTFNRMFCEMWHVSGEILAARDDARALHWALDQLSEPDKFLDKVQSLYADPLAESFDTLHFKDGRVFERFSRPQITNGSPSGRVWSFRDVTARVRTERERAALEKSLRQAQKMESLGTLAGGIAHDFNNILAGMFGSIELARLKLPAAHPAQKWINQAMASAQRAKNLVRQILTFGRHSVTERTPVALGAVAGEALALLRSTFPPGVVLTTRLDPTCAPVLADANQIHQVIVNLCTNAWHALPESGGHIHVTLAPCEITAELTRFQPELKAGDGVRLTVTDDGHGMEAATISRIFDPFFTTKEPGHGTGLGLAIVHGIVAGHGAAITVSSAPGKGTTFDVFFPAITAPPLPAEPPAPDASRGNGEHLLIVDDDEAGLEATGHVLKSLGYHVTACTRPAEALKRFTATPDDFALVITDLAMPGISGDKMTTLLLQIRPTLPVLVISGLAEPQRQDELQRLGARETLLKPFTISELAATVARNVRSAT